MVRPLRRGGSLLRLGQPGEGVANRDPRHCVAGGLPLGVRAEQAPGNRFRPLTQPVLLQSTQLAGTTHNDPVDRMLLAVAQLDGAPLAPADSLILDYAESQGGTLIEDVRR